MIKRQNTPYNFKKKTQIFCASSWATLKQEWSNKNYDVELEKKKKES